MQGILLFIKLWLVLLKELFYSMVICVLYTATVVQGVLRFSHLCPLQLPGHEHWFSAIHCPPFKQVLGHKSVKIFKIVMSYFKRNTFKRVYKYFKLKFNSTRRQLVFDCFQKNILHLISIEFTLVIGTSQKIKA